jgi:PAS domain-containing protein
VTEPEVRHFLLVGAYRDNEVSPLHPLMRTLEVIRNAGGRVQEIMLGPLRRDDVGQLVADALHADAQGIERRQAEEKIRQSEAYLAEAQRLSHTGSFGLSVSSGEIFWSEETFRIFECDRAVKPTLELVLQRVHPEDVAVVQETLARASRDGTDLDFEHRYVVPDGSVKYVHVLAQAVKEEQCALEYVGAVMDVTAPKLSQQALERAFQDLQALQDQHRLVIDTIPGLVWSARPDGAVDFVNQRWLDFTGLAREEALGWGWEAAVHPDDRTRCWRRGARLWRPGSRWRLKPACGGLTAPIAGSRSAACRCVTSAETS